MTTYNVHVYRELRLVFEGIEADSREAVAAIVEAMPTSDADEIDDCDGETFYACVDVVGDHQYEHSRWFDFEPEQLRRAARAMLDALRAFIAADDQAAECGEWKWENLAHAFRMARAAIAEAAAGEDGGPAS